MTINSWKKEFFPKFPSKEMTELQSIKHSLKKWIGLRKSNLEKHNLRQQGMSIVSNEKPSYMEVEWKNFENEKFFPINVHCCSLCIKYFDFTVGDEDDVDDDWEFESGHFACRKCPMKMKLGRDCFTQNDFDIWAGSGNPEQMIDVLSQLVEINKKGK
ncbi:MAG: hypothetical protein WA061_02910 [Microgenomates group bacterium]